MGKRTLRQFGSWGKTDVTTVRELLGCREERWRLGSASLEFFASHFQLHSFVGQILFLFCLREFHLELIPVWWTLGL